MEQYDTDIETLRLKILAEPDEVQKKVLEEHRNVLIEAREQCEFDWLYAEKHWIQDWWYAVALFAAFSMLCCFFFLPGSCCRQQD